MAYHEKVPNRYWLNIGRAFQVHGFCYANLNNWVPRFGEDLTPEKIAYMAELMIFSPKFKVTVKDYDEKTGGFTLIGTAKQEDDNPYSTDSAAASNSTNTAKGTWLDW